MRRIEQQDAYEELPTPETKAPVEKKSDLKKQSQFAPAQIDVTSYVKGDYENKPRGGPRANKAKQSQTPAFRRKLEALSPKS